MTPDPTPRSLLDELDALRVAMILAWGAQKEPNPARDEYLTALWRAYPSLSRQLRAAEALAEACAPDHEDFETQCAICGEMGDRAKDIEHLKDCALAAFHAARETEKPT